MTKLRKNILDMLMRIEKDEGYSNLLLNNEIESKKIPQKDRGLVTEIVYGTLQRKITLDYYLDQFIQKKKKVDLWVRMLLRMSLYQMKYLDKIPDHAIIHEAVEIAKQRGHKGIASLVNGILRNIQRQGVRSFSSIEDETERLAIETSHPVWLVRRWIKTYGFSVTKEMCEANLMRKPLSIRIQPLKITRHDAMERLKEEGYEVRPSSFSEQGIIIEGGNIFQSTLFKENYITVQDQSSMIVGEILNPEPKSYVLDACSAPGGKATHLAEKMNNQGRIDAFDLHKRKVQLIQQKAAALGLTIIHANQGDARVLREKYEPNSFDFILVDAPCSGLGVIRGKPEIKYKKQEEDIVRLQKVQLAILDGVSQLLKPDGTLVYSTCTVEIMENEEVVKQFLAKHKDYRLDPMFREDLPDFLKNAPGLTDYGLQLFPQDFGTDGFFLTRLKKV